MLEEPLLVSRRCNVRYLVGLESSNAALLVEPDRLRLYTDFRCVEAARAVTRAEVVQTRRNLYPSPRGRMLRCRMLGPESG